MGHPPELFDRVSWVVIGVEAFGKQRQRVACVRVHIIRGTGPYSGLRIA